MKRSLSYGCDVIFSAFMSLQVYFLWGWNISNERIAKGVCCSMLGPVFSAQREEVAFSKLGIFGYISLYSRMEDYKLW